MFPLLVTFKSLNQMTSILSAHREFYLTKMIFYVRLVQNQPSMPIELVSEHMEGMIMRVSCAHYHVFCMFLLTGSPLHAASYEHT